MVRLFTGAQGRWQGCRPDDPTPRVYFANHASHLDFVLLWSVLPNALRQRTRPAAAHDYWSASALRRWLAGKVFRALLIERLKVTRESNPLLTLLAALDAGDSIIIFPEGTRQGDPAAPVGEFKGGLYHIARDRPGVALIPVFLENLSRVLPRGEFLPVPLLCSATFGEPLALRPGETRPDFLRRAREAVVNLGTPHE